MRLSATSSTGTAPFTYSWAFVGTPQVRVKASDTVAGAATLSSPGASSASLVDATTDAPSFVPDGVGSYKARLTLTDACGNTQTVDHTVVVGCVGSFTAPATTTDPAVTVSGSIAASNFNVSQSITVSEVVASAFPVTATSTVTPAHSVVPTSGLFYDWSIQTRPAASTAASLSGATTQTVTLTADVAGAYKLRVGVSDGCSVQWSTAVVSVVSADIALGACTVPWSALPIVCEESVANATAATHLIYDQNSNGIADCSEPSVTSTLVMTTDADVTEADLVQMKAGIAATLGVDPSHVRLAFVTQRRMLAPSSSPHARRLATVSLKVGLWGCLLCLCVCMC